MDLHFCVIVCMVCSTTVAQTTLVLPVERTTGLGCIPEGRNVSYECTVTDTSNPPVASTVWQGTAFDCPSTMSSSNNLISLSHIQFLPPGNAAGVCGGLSATSIEVNGNAYVSRLTITNTIGLNGMNVTCSLSGVSDFRTDTIKIGALPPPPINAAVVITSTSSLTVSWSPPTINTSNVKGYMFTVTGACGNCANTTVSLNDPTSVSCSGWTINNQTCYFEVRTFSKDCELTGDADDTSVTLSVPALPNNLRVTPMYRSNGSVQYINVVFTGVNPVAIGGGISSAVSYTIMIGSQSFNGVQCNTSNHCKLTVSKSQLTQDELLSVSVLASNAVGNGIPVTYPMSVPTNLVNQNIVSVTINVADRVVSCQLLDSFPATTPFVCSIAYGISTNNICETYIYTNSSMLVTGGAGDTITINLVEDVNSVMKYCYTLSVSYGSDALIIDGMFSSMCNPEGLRSNPMSTDSVGSVTIPNGRVTYDGVTPRSTAVLTCDSGYEPVAGSDDRTCMPDGNWSEGLQSCMAVAFPWWIIVVIVLTICSGICAGYLCGVCCQLLYEKIRQKKCTTIFLVLLLCIAFGFGLGLLLSYCCCGRKKKCKEDKRQLGKEESHDSRKTPPPPDSLYADPNTIEHQPAPGTEDQYAMVDRKVKKNTKPKPTPPEALYQDPNTIEHETVASGDTYAVVDKPKRSSKKKGGPDVVPPASEGLTYAEIDLSSKRPKPGSGRQAPQQPGEYPKEHPVEYSSVDHGNTSQL